MTYEGTDPDGDGDIETNAVVSDGGSSVAAGELSSDGSDWFFGTSQGIKQASDIGSGGGSGGYTTESVTESGNGSTTTFTFSHTLNTVPEGIAVLPTTRAASTDFWVSGGTTSQIEITFAAAPSTGTDNLGFNLLAAPTDVATVTASGDGTTTTFTLSHGFGSPPEDVVVEAGSRAASTDFWISGGTTSAVEVTFASAPSTGTDNLEFHLST